MNKEVIPEFSFQNPHKKDFGFQIATNREILLADYEDGLNPFQAHRIRFYGLLFVLEGTGCHHIDFKSYAYKRGSLIFMSKEQVHRFEYNDDREAFFLLFTKDFLDRSNLDSDLMQQLSLYNYHLYHPVLQLPESQMTFFEGLVLRVKEEYHAPDDELTEAIIRSSLKIFLCMAERIRKKNREQQKPKKYQIEFLQLEQLLNEHLLQQRQVQFYADTMAISTKKLNRITQEIKQQSAKKYINEVLALEMKRLLMNTSLSMKEVAFKTGFDEPTNFVKYFKKISEVTPIAFRKRYKLTN